MNSHKEGQDIDLVELCKITELCNTHHGKTLENPTTLNRSSSPLDNIEDEELSNTKTGRFHFRFGSTQESK